MVERGARHLALLGRTSRRPAGLDGIPARVRIAAVDVADERASPA